MQGDMGCIPSRWLPNPVRGAQPGNGCAKGHESAWIEGLLWSRAWCLLR